MIARQTPKEGYELATLAAALPVAVALPVAADYLTELTIYTQCCLSQHLKYCHRAQ